MKALQLITSTRTILGLWCKGVKRKRQKETVKKKSGTPNKEKTFYTSVTFTGVSPIKTTAMSMWDHQSQTSHSSNQWLNLPLSKLFHLPQRFLPQCNYRPSLQQLLHLQSLLLCLRRSQLHKAAKNAPGSRPFRKKTKKKKNRSRREQVIEALTPPPLHHPPTTPSLLKKALDPQAISESMPSGPKHPPKAGRIEGDLGGGTGPWRNRCPLGPPNRKNGFCISGTTHCWLMRTARSMKATVSTTWPTNQMLGVPSQCERMPMWEPS
jgi:hypothetical protein